MLTKNLAQRHLTMAFKKKKIGSWSSYFEIINSSCLYKTLLPLVLNNLVMYLSIREGGEKRADRILAFAALIPTRQNQNICYIF